MLGGGSHDLHPDPSRILVKGKFLLQEVLGGIDQQWASLMTLESVWGTLSWVSPCAQRTTV